MLLHHFHFLTCLTNWNFLRIQAKHIEIIIDGIFMREMIYYDEMFGLSFKPQCFPEIDVYLWYLQAD